MSSLLRFVPCLRRKSHEH